jgi:site-specific DNA recombinase
MAEYEMDTARLVTSLPTPTVLERAVLYARVSSDDRNKEGRNLAGQLEMGQRYARNKGYSVVAEISEDDRGASGAEIDLPQLNRVREMAQAGQFDVLVVRELDRLSRNLAKQLIIEEELKRAGVRIEYVLADYDDTPEGRLSKHIRATVAEYEREKIRERMVRGKRLKVKSGSVMMHGKVPYGYRLVENGNGKQELEVLEAEAETVRLIFEWYTVGDGESNGLAINAIARKLSEMGIPRPSGRGKGWARSTVAEILSNETYAGVWHYGKKAKKNGEWVRNPHSYWLSLQVPAIVSSKMWKAAQKRKQYNRENSPRNNKRFQYLLSGRVTCGHCGRKMNGSGSYHKGRKKPYVFYRCPVTYKSSNTGDRECDNKTYFPTQRVDDAVWEWIRSFLTDPEALKGGLETYRAACERENEPTRARLAVVESLIDENRVQLEKLLDLFLAGEFPREMLTERRTRLETTLAALAREQAGLMSRLEAYTLSKDQMQAIKTFAAEVADGLEEADFAAKRSIIETLGVQATLALEEGQRVIHALCVLHPAQETLHFASGSS